MAVAYKVAATIIVDGAELDDDVDRDVDQVVVDEDVALPAMFAITFQDPRRDILDRSGLRVGAAVEISIAGQGGTTDGPLIKGDVVTVECDYDELGARVVVRGYAASYRLQAGRHTRTFINATDSDIVRRVAQEAGIELGLVQETSETHAHVGQANVSDWEFLMSRARAVGFDLDVVDGELLFARSASSAGAPSEAGADLGDASRDPRLLKYGRNLLAFHGRISAAEQVADVEVRGWDDSRMEPVVGTARAGTTAVGLDLADPESLAHFVGDPTIVAVDLAISGQAEADRAAAVLAERIGSAFAKADGIARGNTALRAGTAVRVVGVGEDFSGTYVLSQTRHVIDRLGYRTHFQISGRGSGTPSTVPAGAVGAAGAASPNRALGVGGLVRGIVSDNADPEKLGRVKVHLPWLSDEYESNWMPVAQVEAASRAGAFFVPEVGDEVLVGFEQGDVNTPVVIGSLYNGMAKPDPIVSDPFDNGRVKVRGIVSRDGHHILFADGGNPASGILLRTNDAKQGLVLNQKEGFAQMIGDPKLTIEAYQTLEITSHGDISIKAEGSLKVEAQSVAIKSTGVVDIDGAQIQLN
jgi:phage protein D